MAPDRFRMVPMRGCCEKWFLHIPTKKNKLLPVNATATSWRHGEEKNLVVVVATASSDDGQQQQQSQTTQRLVDMVVVDCLGLLVLLFDVIVESSKRMIDYCFPAVADRPPWSMVAHHHPASHLLLSANHVQGFDTWIPK